MNIGDRIKNRRIELGISVDELASKVGKNRATIYRYENNEIENLPLSTLEPLAVALETTPASLMGWDDKIDRLNAYHDKLSVFLNPNDNDDLDLRKIERARRNMPDKDKQRMMNILKASFDDYFDDDYEDDDLNE